MNAAVKEEKIQLHWHRPASLLAHRRIHSATTVGGVPSALLHLQTILSFRMGVPLPGRRGKLLSIGLGGDSEESCKH
jgi:hypothetical protein